MTAPIRVTVDGEPVTREVTLEQVRAYLRAKGWVRRDDQHRIERWIDATNEFSVFVHTEGHVVEGLLLALGTLARHEGRSPAAVLHEIAGDMVECVCLSTTLELSRLSSRALHDLKAVFGTGQRREAEERPTRDELLAAVEEAMVALLEFAAKPRGETAEAMYILDRAKAALHRVGSGQPREKTPVEQRADEIEEDGATRICKLNIHDALRGAQDAIEDGERAQPFLGAERRRVEAAAWLLVAHRMLAREGR